MKKMPAARRRGAEPDARCQQLLPAEDRAGHRRLDPHVVERRGEEARDHQLPHAQAREGRTLLREDLRSDQGLGVLLRQVQARALPRHHLRALWRRGHALQGAPRAHGPHRARRSGRAHLVPPRHPFVAGLPPHGHHAQGGAQGQAAREGHLLRGEPGHLGRRGAPSGRPARRSRPRCWPSATRSTRSARSSWPAATKSSSARSRPSRRKAPRTPTSSARRKSADKDLVSIRERYEAELDLLQRRVGRVPQPVRPSDPRRRDALARDGRSLRRVLRRRHGCRHDQEAHRSPRPRRGGDQAPRPHRSARRWQAPLGPAQAEGHQAAEDRHRLQPSATRTATGSTTRAP